MNTLYPEIAVFNQFYLQPDAVHRLYVEECGNKEGIPVIFLHGGPGSGCNERHRRYFDPARYRIIIFDQRGCNRSTPNGCIKQNTTMDLLEDMERIREQLNIDAWLVFGGSWGATLGLLYAEKYPARVLGMILRGSFLARKEDLDWFIGQGVNQIFPDYWCEFIDHFSLDERVDLINTLHRKMTTNNKALQEQAANAWGFWSKKVVTATLPIEPNQEGALEDRINSARIEIHYAVNHYFIQQDQILKNIHAIASIPVTIIHGRCDLTCLPISSWLLHKALPGSTLVLVPATGHLASEPAMVDALITATDAITEKIA